MNFLLKYLLKRAGLTAYPKSYVLVNQAPDRAQLHNYPVVEAFVMGGITYYQFEDPFNIPTGRFLASYAAYEEIQMRCDQSYLDKHTRAVERVLTQKQINLQVLSQINVNLAERLQLM